MNRYNREDRRMIPEYRRPGGDHRLFGLVIALIGLLLLLRLAGFLPFNFHFTWPVILIAIGVLVGLKTGFRKNAWWVLILIGGLHLIPRFEINGTSSARLAWPATLVVVGLVLAFKPRPYRRDRCRKTNMHVVTNDGHTLNMDITFGGRKEIITSKEFLGGRLQATFAGCELNLMQADNPSQPIILDMKVAFGGVELIVPSHWELLNEISPSLGSVEDHRTMRTPALEEKRTLILRGSVSFGSVEIKSY